MRIGRSGCLRRNRGHVKAAGGEFEHSLNLLTRHMKLLDDFLYARTCLKIFKNRSHGHPRVTEHPRAAALPRNALHGLALRPIEICHVLTSLHGSWLRRVLPRLGGVVTCLTSQKTSPPQPALPP